MSTVPIHEDFENYRPPRWFRRKVERLLAPLEVGHTNGLAAIVLTNGTVSDRRKGQRRRRRFRHRPGLHIGRYFPAFRGRQPWIELVVDRIVGQMPHVLQFVPVIQDMIVSEVLYHEIGHHLHETVGSAARGGEPSAEAWRKKLFRLYFSKHHRYMRFVAPLARAFVRRSRRHRP